MLYCICVSSFDGLERFLRSLVLATVIMSCLNGSTPLLLPWTNHSVSAISDSVVTRGIAFTAGSPAQSFSLTPSTTSDNIFVGSAEQCGASINQTCVAQFGGVFDSTKSTSFTETNYAKWGGSRESIDWASDSSYVFFADSIAIGQSPNTRKLVDLPMYTNRSTQASTSHLLGSKLESKGGLPLGIDSVFLSHLVDSGQVSSKVYGLWAGSEAESASQDGLLVIGGYDETRLKSPATTFPMFSDCPTCAVITAITYDAGGESTSLFTNATETLAVALDPFSYDIELPSEMLHVLLGAEKKAVWNESSQHLELPATTLPSGTITVTISDLGNLPGGAPNPSAVTYKTTIPAADLYHFPRSYNKEGLLEIENTTTYRLAVTNQSKTARVSNLGLPFFTQNYLIVDPDARNFQLAPAVLTPADPKGADAKVKQVCRFLPSTKQKSQVAAIVGAVVGSILGTLLLVGLFWYVYRRKQKGRGQHARGESETGTVISTKQLVEQRPIEGPPSERSLELPLQAPPPIAIPMRPRSTRSTRSKDVTTSDPSRGLSNEIRNTEEENDGRLLNERPLGLSETIHSRSTLPRVLVD